MIKKLLTLAFPALMTLSLSAFAATSNDKPKADEKKEDKKKFKKKDPHAF
ncbi:MAG: hypothetical protein K7J47_17135 [Acidobacteria bacterium]|nr:hypothetical protein [Bryobacteraceae bacterium CoA2 C42]MCA2966547.1 hypothetical protein [Acidobacteriaceae bacterium]